MGVLFGVATVVPTAISVVLLDSVMPVRLRQVAIRDNRRYLQLCRRHLVFFRTGFEFLCFVVVAFFIEEGFEDFVVKFLQDATDRFELVVALGQCAEVGGAADAAHFRIGEAVDHFAHARDDHGAGAHGAGLFGHVKRALVESPVADVGGGLGDGEDLGVGGRVVGGARLVVGGGDHAALVFDHGTDGHFVLFPCFDRFVVSMCHVVVRIAVELGWEDLFEWAVHCGRREWCVKC